MCNILKPAKITIRYKNNGGFKGNLRMKFTNLRVRRSLGIVGFFSLFLGIMLTGSLFASDRQLQFEIVPFDYADEDMRSSWLMMMTDSSDQDMQKYYSQADIDGIVLKIADRQIFLCRSNNEFKRVYGFIETESFDRFYCWQHATLGLGWTIDRIIEDPEFTLLRTVDEILWINNIAVRKDYRGCGIAQAMMLFAQEKAQLSSKKYMGLQVEVDNVKAQHAYRKCGFEIDLTLNENVKNYNMIKKLN